MKKTCLFVGIVLASAISSFSLSAKADLGYQDHSSFVSAIHTSTSSVSEYVLIQVTNLNDNSTSNFCVSANFFMGAIHLEYGLSYSQPDISKAYEIAASNKSHHYSFSKKEAMSSMPIYAYHSVTDVAIIRNIIKNYTPNELKTGLSPRGNLWNKIRNKPSVTKNFGGRHYLAFSASLACALISRGFRVNDSGGGANVVGN